MSCIMRKLDFCLCEQKGADQMCSNLTADQGLCFFVFATKILTKFCEFEHSDISVRINGENNNIAFVYYVNCLEGSV